MTTRSIPLTQFDDGIRSEEDVAGLEIAMDHVLLVQIRERLARESAMIHNRWCKAGAVNREIVSLNLVTKYIYFRKVSMAHYCLDSS